MTVMNFLKIYELDDKEAEEKFMLVKSDDFNHDMVCLSLDDEEHIITVSADDLIKAIKNATNH